MPLTVGDVAKLAHVSVRTLHHYDAIGLLAPSGRSDSGYRLYTDADLEKLQQILFFRELGFALEDIQRMLSARNLDRHDALVAQRAMLVDKVERLRAMVSLVDKTLEGLERGVTMTREEMFEVFGDFDPSQYEDEAKQRWGETSQYAESQRRTKRYGKDEWKAIRAEGDALEAALAAAMADGAAPTDARCRDLAERHRLWIDRWFYPCPKAMHASLGQMYVSDERFAQHYEKRAAGLAQFVCDAIRANADRS